AIAVALADKLDTLVGFWAIGEKPTGSGDPYQLRRAALGVIRIVLENDMRLPLCKVFRRPYRELFAQTAGRPPEMKVEKTWSFDPEVFKRVALATRSMPRSIEFEAFFAENIDTIIDDEQLFD